MKLPPLNALRAFDAAARLGGIRLAAQDLNVTPAAVSQQIRLLEDYLQAPLFERKARSIELTDTGRAFHSATTRHLRAIATAAERARSNKQSVHVTSVPSFAARWVVPRLPSFIASHPNTEVRVDANPALIDLSQGEYDLGVRLGGGKYRGADSHLLFPVNLVPVASPAYRQTIFGPKGPGWPGARLIHESPDDFWFQWLEMAGVTGMDVARGLYFSHTILALSSTLQGQGVTLVPRFMVREELDSGTLEVVDTRELKTGSGYYLAWSLVHGPLSDAATAFRDWLIEEARNEPQAQPLP